MIAHQELTGRSSTLSFTRRVRGVTRHPLLAMDALASLIGASIMIRALPFRLTARLAGYRGNPRAAADMRLARRVRWLVRGWARLLPWRAKCFEQGLAAQWMLRRRGIASRFHYGVARDADEMSAHVWVSIGDAILIGESDAGRHRCLMIRP